MSERFRTLLEEWKKADREASLAQAALNVKFMAFAEGKGPEPTEDERQRVEALRLLANGSLQVAIEYMKRASEGPTVESRLGDLES